MTCDGTSFWQGHPRSHCRSEKSLSGPAWGPCPCPRLGKGAHTGFLGSCLSQKEWPESPVSQTLAGWLIGLEFCRSRQNGWLTWDKSSETSSPCVKTMFNVAYPNKYEHHCCLRRRPLNRRTDRRSISCQRWGKNTDDITSCQRQSHRNMAGDCRSSVIAITKLKPARNVDPAAVKIWAYWRVWNIGYLCRPLSPVYLFSSPHCGSSVIEDMNWIWFHMPATNTGYYYAA